MDQGHGLLRFGSHPLRARHKNLLQHGGAINIFSPSLPNGIQKGIQGFGEFALHFYIAHLAVPVTRFELRDLVLISVEDVMIDEDNSNRLS